MSFMNFDAQFIQFSKKYYSTFERISAATRLELSPGDVENEAWLLAKEWELEGIPARFDDRSYVDKLFSHLYQKLVRYNEKNLRYAVRTDHWIYGDESESSPHPLLNKLASDEGSQPLESLLAREEAKNQPVEPGPDETRAGAYLCLIRRYNNRMKCVANHLMISLSYCYYRFNEAIEAEGKQCAIPCTIERQGNVFTPGPWRSFRLSQPWVQMELDLMPPTELWDEDYAPNFCSSM